MLSSGLAFSKYYQSSLKINPLWAKDLVSLWVPFYGRFIELKTGKFLSGTGPSQTKHGFGISVSGVDTGVDYNQFNGTNPITVATYISYGATIPAGNVLFAQGTEIVLRNSGSAQNTDIEFLLNSFSTNDRVSVTTSNSMVNRAVTAIGTYGPSGKLTATVDGILNNSVVPTGTYANVAANFFIGNNGLLVANTSTFFMVALYAREWSDVEKIAFNNNPLQLVAPVRNRKYFIPSAPVVIDQSKHSWWHTYH